MNHSIINSGQDDLQSTRSTETDLPVNQQTIDDDEVDVNEAIESSTRHFIERALCVVGQGRYQRRTIGILGLGNASDAVEILAVGYIITVFIDPVSQQPVDTLGSVSGVLNASVFAGMLLGGLLMGWLGDRVGRRVALIVSLVLNCTCALLSACTPLFPAQIQIQTFVLARFVAGVGVGGSVPSVFTLAAEISPAKDRGSNVTWVSWFWMVGALYTALSAWLVLHDMTTSANRWPLFALMVALPSGAASACTWLYVLESPWFLYKKGQTDRAVEALKHMAAINGTGHKLQVFLDLETEHTNNNNYNNNNNMFAGEWGGEDETDSFVSPPHGSRNKYTREIVSVGGSESVGLDGSLNESIHMSGNRNKCVSDVIIGGVDSGSIDGDGAFEDGTVEDVGVSVSVDGGIRGCLNGVRQLCVGAQGFNTAMVGLIWFCLSFGSYGIASWISDLFKKIGFENVYSTSFFYALANLPGNAGSTLLVNRISRRRLVGSALLLSAFSAIVFALSSTPTAIVIGAMLFNAFSVAAWNGLNLLSAEAFHGEVRSTGMGVVAAVGRLGSVSATLINGILLERNNVTAVILLAGSAMVLGSIAVALSAPADELLMGARQRQIRYHTLAPLR